jgi:hypothetical protein
VGAKLDIQATLRSANVVPEVQNLMSPVRATVAASSACREIFIVAKKFLRWLRAISAEIRSLVV